MIYFDNSATTLKKPPEVAEAVMFALNNFGNAGRSFHAPSMEAGRAVYEARELVAELVGLDDPLGVSFCSSATEALNLIIGGLIGPNNHVITTETEHNSVLRPLYLSGCKLTVLKSDGNGRIWPDELEKTITPDTDFFVCSHGSNLTGNLADAAAFYRICRDRGVTMILDAAQTMGLLDVRADMADIICFTGHKGLFGPQGTGGIIMKTPRTVKITKTGGAGGHSFEKLHSTDMPDVFEVGTVNAHGIHGLAAGVRFVLETGIGKIHEREMLLTKRFVNGITGIRDIVLYGDFTDFNRLPVVSINLRDLSSSDLSLRLWEEFQIATRPQSHCAPLLHQCFGTEGRGMVRFSFSYFNTEAEIDKAVEALKIIAKL